MDVDGDGFVSPRDALLPINELNQGKSGLLEPPTDNAGIATHLYIDPSKDNFLSPIDALLVINFLNQAAGQGEGEGEEARKEWLPADICLPKLDVPELEQSWGSRINELRPIYGPQLPGAASNTEHPLYDRFNGSLPSQLNVKVHASGAEPYSESQAAHDLAIATMELGLESALS